jgi:hypothetical protein
MHSIPILNQCMLHAWPCVLPSVSSGSSSTACGFQFLANFKHLSLRVQLMGKVKDKMADVKDKMKGDKSNKDDTYDTTDTYGTTGTGDKYGSGGVRAATFVTKAGLAAACMLPCAALRPRVQAVLGGALACAGKATAAQCVLRAPCARHVRADSA